MNKDHETFIQALQSRSYEGLWIKRHGSSCWLIIRIDVRDHCFVNRFGKAPDYHHAWQIRKWLHENFGIPGDTVLVEVYKLQAP